MSASKRIERISRQLQRELSQIILYELEDHRIGFVTVTKVKPASDLKSARVYISVFAGQTNQKQSIDCLNRASGYIQKIIGPRLKLRFLPNLTFFLDDSIEKQFTIFKLIEKEQAIIKSGQDDKSQDEEQEE